MEEIVQTERIGHVLRITLDRPKVNAISRALGNAIHAAAKLLHTDPELRVGIITAKGDKVFSAGWDFNEATQNAAAETEAQPYEGGFAGITAYWDLKKPLIAAVNGAAIGGGFEIALAADVILMADHAYLQLPEIARGFLPDAGGIQRLPRRIPYNVAMEMILSGRRMDAAEAVSWGLARKAVPSDRLQDETLELATQIAEGAPLALQALKEVMQAIEGQPLKAAMEMSSAGTTPLPILTRMWRSEDAKEGPRAFLEKRPPKWRGQ